MAYSDFDLEKVTTDFSLTQVHNLDLFGGVAPIQPNEYLREWLAEFAPIAIGLGSERGRGESIIFPVLAEAKRRSAGPVTVPGLGQCAAEMVAIRIFNEKKGHPLPTVFGCSTSGGSWRFLKLEADTLFIDKTEYHLSNLPAILGILVSIAGSAPPV